VCTNVTVRRQRDRRTGDSEREREFTFAKIGYKMWKMGWFGEGRSHPRSLKIVSFHSTERIRIPISFHGPRMYLSCTVSEILVENRRFQLIPPLFVASVGGDRCRISLIFFGIRKLESMGYLTYGVVCLIPGLAILVEHSEYRLVTDGQTHDDAKYTRYHIASRG